MATQFMVNQQIEAAGSGRGIRRRGRTMLGPCGIGVTATLWGLSLAGATVAHVGGEPHAHPHAMPASMSEPVWSTLIGMAQAAAAPTVMVVVGLVGITLLRRWLGARRG
ncbi:MAG: hypothetical protein KDK91_33985 [Gammaproteobacteria bacterium]|nr:hypothetical protein [Gammaproteobacteria bacterium]